MLVLWREAAVGVGRNEVLELLRWHLERLGYCCSHVADRSGAVIGLDEQSVEGCGSEGHGIETVTEGEVAAAVEQEPCHALVGTHAVDGKGDIGEARMAAHVKQALSGPHAVGNDGFAQGMGQLQVTQKRVGLDVEAASAQGVHAGFADGEYLWVLGAPLEQGPVARREAVHVMPGVKAHRVTAPW